MSISTVGLLLQSIPYLGKSQILKVFTPDQGLIALFSRKTTLTPFLLAEWVFRKSSKEMHSLQECTLIDPLFSLKSSYSTLSCAGCIAQDLLRTQLPQKKAPELFDLTLFYLQKLTLAPELLAASFRLKLLWHEGLLSEEIDPSFTAPEWDQVQTLAFSRDLSAIQRAIPPHSKIRQLFETRCS